MDSDLSSGGPIWMGIREFAEMLLDISHYRNRERDRVKQASESIIKQALGEQTDSLKEEFDN